MQTSAEQAPSVHRVVARYLKLAFHANICPDVVHAGSHDLAVFCADFHSVCRCCVYESVDEVLEFTIAAAHKMMSSANRRCI